MEILRLDFFLELSRTMVICKDQHMVYHSFCDSVARNEYQLKVPVQKGFRLFPDSQFLVMPVKKSFTRCVLSHQNFHCNSWL